MTRIEAATRIPKLWFAPYLRTGATPWEAEESVELKFNPWHDPKTGRFTFKGGGGGSGGGGGASGTWQGGGFTGGGGSFDGGGASGSWGLPAPAKSQPKQRSTVAASAAAQAAAPVSAANAPRGQLVVRNGYAYTLDSADRTTAVKGTLTLTADQQRSRSAQAAAGGSDRLSTDDGGHYIAARFNGPTDTFNHFAQDANFNRGGYRVLENVWMNDIKAGKQVYVAITPAYDGSSRRPSTITVMYSVNGARETRSFPNSSRSKSRGQ